MLQSGTIPESHDFITAEKLIFLGYPVKTND